MTCTDGRLVRVRVESSTALALPVSAADTRISHVATAFTAISAVIACVSRNPRFDEYSTQEHSAQQSVGGKGQDNL